MELGGKVAIITGAGSGIGRATALRLAAAGAKVVVADYADEGGRETVNLISAAAGEALFVHCDVSNEEEVRELVEQTESHFGGLDILFNNAGTLTGPKFPDAPPRYFKRTVDINLTGVLNGIYFGVPAMRRRGGGAIVITASVAGLSVGSVDPIYTATKTALVALTRTLVFLEAESAIRVNCVCPGLVTTQIEQTSGRTLDADDRQKFVDSRVDNRSRQKLVADDIATAVLRLIEDESLNGKAYRVVLGQEWELV